MEKLRIGVVRGGTSSEYTVSLKTGAAILDILKNKLGDRYDAVDILVDDAGVWHMHGLPLSREALQQNVDVIYNALHGTYGEDGGLEYDMEHMDIPVTSATFLGGESIVDKSLAKEQFRSLGYKTPGHVIIRRDQTGRDEEYLLEQIQKVFNELPPPWIVKPLLGGSSEQVLLARSFQELVSAVQSGLEKHENILVEEYVKGRPVTAGLIPQFRNTAHYHVPPISFGGEGDILSYEDRHNGTYKQFPGYTLDDTDKTTLSRMMETVAETFHLSHPFTGDFVVTPQGVYIIEIDALPALDEHAPFLRLLEGAGIDLSQFVTHVIDRVRGDKDLQ